MNINVVKNQNVSVPSGSVMESQIAPIKVMKKQKCAKTGSVSQIGSAVIITNVFYRTLFVMVKMIVPMDRTNLFKHVQQ